MNRVSPCYLIVEYFKYVVLQIVVIWIINMLPPKLNISRKKERRARIRDRPGKN